MSEFIHDSFFLHDKYAISAFYRLIKKLIILRFMGDVRTEELTLPIQSKPVKNIAYHISASLYLSAFLQNHSPVKATQFYIPEGKFHENFYTAPCIPRNIVIKTS